MKIGILTFIDTTNYGALLQAYALQNYLYRYSDIVEIIQYKCPAVSKQEHGSFFSLTGLLRKLLFYRSHRSKKNKFALFSEKYISKGCSISGCNKYDVIIVGSDQVWNQKITGNDDTFFLNFVKHKCLKLSYAASFGNDDFPENRVNEVSKLLDKFDSISVREESALPIIKSLIKKEASLVVDPTILLDKIDWKPFVKKIEQKPYILVYFPHNKKKCFNFVDKLKKVTGYDVVYLSISPKIQLGVKTIYDASPEEWLSYIYYAGYVVTGSFHGTVFSILFEKQFFFESYNDNSRIGCITKYLNINSNLTEDIDLNYKINYQQVNERLVSLKSKSVSWLNKTLYE